ncbi:MAG: hypothetical protein NDJ75_04015 [Thermoanaerobaculia bacterium]|nr:hypothetical protein [Thermoanaerobaculia bacterium]
MPARDPQLEALRHAVATVAYRGGKTLRGAPPEFAEFRVAAGSRTPLELLAHLNDLFDWALHLAEGEHVWQDSTPISWTRESERFHATLAAFDQRLACGRPLGFPPAKLFQGPVADALTHVGQLAMLRRLAGSPVRGENYFQAEIVAGRVGAEQAPPRREFD